ncbi:MAG: PadR family transcriptional regulator [Corallococcus sp.]|nr:PadR family transcriptional regulator [Corallococcus sp.]
MSGDFTFLKGNIETIILRALCDNDKYGYELAKEIKEKTENKYEIKQPTLYSYLKRLEDDELIVSYWGENSNGGRRRYYKITKTGRENCERFLSEWNFQRSVLGNLMDGVTSETDATQSDVTPLFGRKSNKRTKNRYQATLDEQDEIARRLSELVGGDAGNSTYDTQSVLNPATIETEPSNETFETVATSVGDADTTESQTKTFTEPSESSKARFEVNQDNAEVFLKSFEERAREVSERAPGESEPSEGENYQHILMGVLGEQLDDMRERAPDLAAERSAYYTEQLGGLEDVADTLAKEGIRVRIYNHATAVYKSKMLIPLSKVLCQTAWISYALAFIYYGILAITSIGINNWVPFVITIGALLVVPVAFSINAIVDPTRKDKPLFNFKIVLIVAMVLALVIVSASVGFSALGNIEFSDYAAVSKQILIPVGIALLLPASIVIYNQIYKRY